MTSAEFDKYLDSKEFMVENGVREEFIDMMANNGVDVTNKAWDSEFQTIRTTDDLKAETIRRLKLMGIIEMYALDPNMNKSEEQNVYVFALPKNVNKSEVYATFNGLLRMRDKYRNVNKDMAHYDQNIFMLRYDDHDRILDAIRNGVSSTEIGPKNLVYKMEA